MKHQCGVDHETTFQNFFWQKNAPKLKRPDGAWLMRTEKRMIKKVEGIFKKQQKWLLEESQRLSFLQNSIEQEVDDLVDELPYKRELADEIVVFMKSSMTRGGKSIVRRLKMKERFGIGFDILNPKATEFLQNKEDFELSNFAGNIDHTTKKLLKKVLIDAHDKGQSYNVTAKKIQELSTKGVFSRARAQLIAVRETGVAYEEGNAQVMNDFRVKFPTREVEKEWVTVNDGRVTPSHTKNQEMGWIHYNMEFVGTNDQHAPAEKNPRCRCFTAYNILEKE